MATPTANDAKTRTPTIKIAGQSLSDGMASQLISMRVERCVDTPSSVSLRFFDQYFELFDAVSCNIGDELEVLIPASDSAVTTVFLGKVTELGIEQEDEDASQRLIVEAHDVSHQLAHASDFTAYLDHTVSDIVTEIASRHSLTPKVDKTTGKSYRLQTSTDLYFLNQLATEVGYEWFVHGDELHFRERPTTAGPELALRDGSLMRVSARYSGARVPKKVTVTGWDPSTQKGVTGTWDGSSAPGASVLRSNSDLATTQYGKAVSTFGKELVVPTEGIDDQKAATTRAELIGHRLAGAGLQISGIARCDPAIQAGHLLTLKGIGDKLSGDYYVTRVVHEFGESQELRTRFVSE
ncbi:MAG: contractile injection system protein, VgrG/Pvc8 family, partial [Phycisphaeraceae bacterium]